MSCSSLQNYLDSFRRSVEARVAYIRSVEELQPVLSDGLGAGIAGPDDMRISARRTAEIIKNEHMVVNKELKIIDGLEKRLKDAAVSLGPRLDARRKLLSFSASWVGGWTIGTGSFGTAILWAKQNKEGTITDRLVLKETRLDEGDWGSLTNFWTTKPNAPKDSR
ncbi:hypothetical protein LTR85_011824 [Meristemomyces frigidus]|nr:hypothetical protein LTR85_011824 [Meristemomyces frigidus]